jgi:hypothetical protein
VSQNLTGSEPLFSVVNGYNVNLLENGFFLSMIATGDPRKSVRHLAKQDDSCIPASNKYMLLNNLNDSTRPKLSDAAVKNWNSAVAIIKKQRGVLIGDNHIKRCSEKISNLSDDSYNVTGITKPNANL